jgi:glycosyltransferase involved in cell wall biosynthesis
LVIISSFVIRISSLPMRVLVIANNLQQASYRLRVEALREVLAQRGIDLDVQLRPDPWIDRRKLYNSAQQYDAVLLQRKLLEVREIRWLRRFAKRIFFDVDDAVMYPGSRRNPIHRWRVWRRFAAHAGRVDLVVAGNEYLADIFRRAGAPAVVLPTVVDARRYQVKSHAPSSAPALVWIGSRSTLGYLRRFAAALQQSAARVKGLRLIVIADESPTDLPLAVEHVRWSAATEAAALCRGDIGIAPMPADRWTLGKCGFKIIQYMAAGLPVIASPIGANARIVLPGQTGLLPQTDAQWADAVATLAADPQLRQAMGGEGRRRVEQEYSLKRAADVWEKALSMTNQ